MELHLVLKAWQRLNREMFDKMLPTPHFNFTTRGNFPVRYGGHGVYKLNPAHVLTENDLILEMCFHLAGKEHRWDTSPTKDVMNEAYSRGYKDGDSPVIQEAQPKPKATYNQKKWTCGCTIVRCGVELAAISIKCNNEFVKEE